MHGLIERANVGQHERRNREKTEQETEMNTDRILYYAYLIYVEPLSAEGI